MSQVSDDLRKLLKVPDGGNGEVQLKGGLLYTPSNGNKYPMFNGIPWFFENPRATLFQWQGQIESSLSAIAREVDRLHAVINEWGQLSQELPAESLDRVKTQKEFKQKYLNQLEEILKEFIDKKSKHLEANQILAYKIPSAQRISSYVTNIFRDWVWGEKENAYYLKIADEFLVKDAPLGDAVILGAGACRFPYDFHEKLRQERKEGGITCALDFNPLLLAAGKTICDGSSLDLVEFPNFPKKLSDCAVEHVLKAPQKASQGLEFLFADAMNPPFRSSSLSTVITPWLIDIIPQPFSLFVKKLNRLLKKGGRWLNFGSLVFHNPNPYLQHSSEEVVQILESNGFRVQKQEDREVPYLSSPHSQQTRFEKMMCFVVEKLEDTNPAPFFRVLPEWILKTNQPVPKDKIFDQDAFAYRLYGDLLKEVNNKKSIEDLAEDVSRDYRMSKDVAIKSVQQFFVRMWEQKN